MDWLLVIVSVLLLELVAIVALGRSATGASDGGDPATGAGTPIGSADDGDGTRRAVRGGVAGMSDPAGTTTSRSWRASGS